jgi:hypothetical protein
MSICSQTFWGDFLLEFFVFHVGDSSLEVVQLADSVEKEETEHLIIPSSPMLQVDVENDERAARKKDSELFQFTNFYLKF